MTVVSINEYSKDDWCTGEVICTHCKHEWVTCGPVGATQFECPKCQTMKGILKYPFNASEGDEQWVCLCGSQYFYITRSAVRCRECGATQRPFD